MQLEDSPFKKGLYMKVPKGTPLLSRWYGTSSEATSRDVVVEISDVSLPSHASMLTEAEKANLLDSQKGMVVFTETNEAKLDDVGYHGDKTAINDAEKALVEKAISSMNLPKNAFKKAIDYKSMAVSFANKGAALMFKLSYTGDLQITVLDLETLKEAVDA